MTALEKLRELERKATPGPWVVASDDGRRNTHIDAMYPQTMDADGRCICTTWDRGKKENRHFIAASRHALPALLALASAAIAHRKAENDTTPQGLINARTTRAALDGAIEALEGVTGGVA